MPTDDDDEIIIIRRAQNSPRLTPQDRSFLVQIECDLRAGTEINWLDRGKVRQLLGRVVFGAS